MKELLYYKEVEGWDELEEIRTILNKSLEAPGERVVVKIEVFRDEEELK